MREALDGDDLDARSGDGHNRAAGKEGAKSDKGSTVEGRCPGDGSDSLSVLIGGKELQFTPPSFGMCRRG
ncbi:hypothetical protein GCM10028793_43810 [Nocardiopsis oceani]